MVYRTAIRKNTPIAQTHSYFSNNFKLSASTIAQFYKARWMIEIYFRNIKQLQKIQSFIGTSRNAVETQIWTALSTMLLLCQLKHIVKYKWGRQSCRITQDVIYNNPIFIVPINRLGNIALGYKKGLPPFNSGGTGTLPRPPVHTLDLTANVTFYKSFYLI